MHAYKLLSEQKTKPSLWLGAKIETISQTYLLKTYVACVVWPNRTQNFVQATLKKTCTQKSKSNCQKHWQVTRRDCYARMHAYETNQKPIHSCHADWLSPDFLDLVHLQTKMVPSPDWWRWLFCRSNFLQKLSWRWLWRWSRLRLRWPAEPHPFGPPFFFLQLFYLN